LFLRPFFATSLSKAVLVAVKTCLYKSFSSGVVPKAFANVAIESLAGFGRKLVYDSTGWGSTGVVVRPVREAGVAAGLAVRRTGVLAVVAGRDSAIFNAFPSLFFSDWAAGEPPGASKTRP
jgi:hypothetical protein